MFNIKVFVFILLGLGLSACTHKTEISVECKQLASEIEKLNHDHFLNCVTACFRTAYVQVPQNLQESKKELIKNACTNSCRDNIDYDVINHIKAAIDEKYNCGFDFSKPMEKPNASK
jgi:hypothetical protein